MAAQGSKESWKFEAFFFYVFWCDAYGYVESVSYLLNRIIPTNSKPKNTFFATKNENFVPPLNDSGRLIDLLLEPDRHEHHSINIIINQHQGLKNRKQQRNIRDHILRSSSLLDYRYLWSPI